MQTMWKSSVVHIYEWSMCDRPKYGIWLRKLLSQVGAHFPHPCKWLLPLIQEIKRWPHHNSRMIWARATAWSVLLPVSKLRRFGRRSLLFWHQVTKLINVTELLSLLVCKSYRLSNTSISILDPKDCSECGFQCHWVPGTFLFQFKI